MTYNLKRSKYLIIGSLNNECCRGMEVHVVGKNKPYKSHTLAAVKTLLLHAEPNIHIYFGLSALTFPSPAAAWPCRLVAMSDLAPRPLSPT